MTCSSVCSCSVFPSIWPFYFLLFCFQWTTCTVLCRSDSADVWVPPFTRSHIQRSEAWEPSHRPPWLHSGENITNEHILLLCIICPHRAHAQYMCSRLPGDRLWICQEGKRPDLDVVRDTGVPGAGNHPQQSKSLCLRRICFNICLQTHVIIRHMWRSLLKKQPHIPVICLDCFRAITKPWTGGPSEFSSMKWQPATLRSLQINLFRSMRRLCLERWAGSCFYS